MRVLPSRSVWWPSPNLAGQEVVALRVGVQISSVTLVPVPQWDQRARLRTAKVWDRGPPGTNERVHRSMGRSLPRHGRGSGFKSRWIHGTVVQRWNARSTCERSEVRLLPVPSLGGKCRRPAFPLYALAVRMDGTPRSAGHARFRAWRLWVRVPPMAGSCRRPRGTGER